MMPSNVTPSGMAFGAFAAMAGAGWKAMPAAMQRPHANEAPRIMFAIPDALASFSG
jgi:hypothetical protein